MEITYERAPSMVARNIRDAVATVAGGLGVLTAVSYVGVDAPPTALYAEVAMAYDLPGANITDSISERGEALTRRKVLEATRAEPMATVETSSGVTVELFRSGKDRSAFDIEVDERAVDASVDFVIEHLDDQPQNVISADEILDLQERAADGELDNVSVAAVVSFEFDHCVDKRELSFVECPDSNPEWLAGGVTSRSNGSGEGMIRPTVLVTRSSDDPFQNISQDQYDQTDPDAADAASIVWVHELTHAIVGAVPVDMSEDEEHEFLVDPIEHEASLSMLGLLPQGADPLPPVFRYANEANPTAA